MTDDEAIAVAERLMKIDTGHVSDALERVGVRTPVLSDRFRPFTSAARFAGRAVTLELARSRTGTESRRLSEFLDETVHPVSVGVIAAHVITTTTPFGDRAALVMQRNGATGAILDGAVRDVDALEALGFPVHAVGRALPPMLPILQEARQARAPRWRQPHAPATSPAIVLAFARI